jgi:hypothetical protein
MRDRRLDGCFARAPRFYHQVDSGPDVDGTRWTRRSGASLEALKSSVE